MSVEVLADPVEDSAGELVLLPHPRVELEDQVSHQPLPLLEVGGGGGDECVRGECEYGGGGGGGEMNMRGEKVCAGECGWWGGMNACVGVDECVGGGGCVGVRNECVCR